MDLLLKRIFKSDAYSIGNLYIDGVKYCDTLEDTDRGLTSAMSLEDIKLTKRAGITAIPTGKYAVTLHIQSPKFKHYTQYEFCDGKLPRLVGVPGYDGVLIHIGNGPENTDGCVLVGKNTIKGRVTNSTATFKALYARMQEANKNNESIYITIE